MTRARHAVHAGLAGLLLLPSPLQAHSGPPFPVATQQIAGPYRLSLWTDPDATDDRTPGGQFWVVIEPRADGTIPASTRARVAIRPIDRDEPFVEVAAERVLEGAAPQHLIAAGRHLLGPEDRRLGIDVEA